MKKGRKRNPVAFIKSSVCRGKKNADSTLLLRLPSLRLFFFPLRAFLLVTRSHRGVTRKCKFPIAFVRTVDLRPALRLSSCLFLICLRSTASQTPTRAFLFSPFLPRFLFLLPHRMTHELVSVWFVENFNAFSSPLNFSPLEPRLLPPHKRDSHAKHQNTSIYYGFLPLPLSFPN